MRDVWIFGDSFADNFWPKPVEGFKWTNCINENYSVSNLAKIGTGPDYSLDKFLDLCNSHPKEDLKNISVIFFSADAYRLNLKCYNDPMQSSEIYEAAQGNIKNKSTLFAKQLFQWYLDIDYKIRTDIQYLATVNHMSQYFKQILYWPVTPIAPTVNKFLDTASNVTIPDKCLIDISVIDCGHQILGLEIDPRANHLHEANHLIMYDQLTNWIENFSPIDTSKFKFVSSLENK